MGADEPANGQEVIEGNKQYLHGNPYGAAITPDGRADCEAGQRGYLERNATLLRQEVQDRAGRADARRAGPDLHRAAPACPPGQTFTAIPETGQYAKIAPSSSGER